MIKAKGKLSPSLAKEDSNLYPNFKSLGFTQTRIRAWVKAGDDLAGLTHPQGI